MHVVIMGCGRVGSPSRAARRLGHEVAVIDQDPQAFRRLGADFSGRQVIGQGFDREVLVEAGIERAPGVRGGLQRRQLQHHLARGWPGRRSASQRVVARIYDAKRAEVYERLGIPTVATVPWTPTGCCACCCRTSVASSVARAHRHGR